MAAGFGIDDGAALHFRDARPCPLVTARAEANAYCVESNHGTVLESPIEIERIRVGHV